MRTYTARCKMFCQSGEIASYCLLHRGVAIRVYFAGKPYQDFRHLKQSIGLTKITVNGRCVLNLT